MVASCVSPFNSTSLQNFSIIESIKSFSAYVENRDLEEVLLLFLIWPLEYGNNKESHTHNIVIVENGDRFIIQIVLWEGKMKIHHHRSIQTEPMVSLKNLGSVKNRTPSA